MTDQSNDDLRPRAAGDGWSDEGGETGQTSRLSGGPEGPRDTGLKARATTVTTTATAVALIALLIGAAGPHAQQAAGAPAGAQAQAARAVPAALTSTPRPAIPSTISALWLVPERPAKPERAAADFAEGVKLLQNARYAEALPLLGAPGLAGTPLAQYAAYFTGVAYLNLSRASEARTLFARLRAEKAPGFLSEGAALREAEAAVAQGDQAGAAKIYAELSQRKTAAPDAVLLALGRAQAAAGDRRHAAESFAKLYFEFPLSDLAAMAATELDGLKDLEPLSDPAARLKLEVGRAERLFGAKRYPAARQAFEELQPLTSGDDAEVAGLRVAESDFYLRRYRQARDGLAPYLDKASRKAEAQFFHLASLRELDDHDEYVQRARALVAAFPDSSWAEETLNNLATHYILVDEDEEADAVFRELYQRFPKGRHAERAAWKAGWWSYKHGRHHEASALFEGAASTFPRSDYRPAYLYWSGRARDAAGDRAGAQTVLQVVVADYLNSYYGRLAAKRLGPAATRAATTAQPARPVVPVAAADPEPPSPPGSLAASAAQGALVRQLISLELYEAARDELLYAQRNGDDSPALNATLAWVYNKLGDYRRGIIIMKRAYPTYMSAEGASLPGELLKVIFPIDYWPLIKRYAPARNLDPYLVAALINQESSFLADAKSSANAIGLMQLLPSTARRYARTLRIRRYSVSSLTKPEVNIQLGTAYFAELVRRLGEVHYALASYNAGESRIAAWTAERPGLDRDEFIDDIPFPETQGYVKKILGTTEDYRRLYGPGGRLEADGGSSRPSVAAPATRKPTTGKTAAPTTLKKKPKAKPSRGRT